MSKLMYQSTPIPRYVANLDGQMPHLLDRASKRVKSTLDPPGMLKQLC